MSIRATSWIIGETPLLPRFGEGARPAGPEAGSRRVFDEGETELEAGGRNTLAITEILRGSDLEAVLHGVTGSEFLFGDWAVELPFAGGNEDLDRLPDLQGLIDKGVDTALVLPDAPELSVETKGADIAEVLPGIMGDEFLLSKDAGLPLVLPDGDPEMATLDTLPRFPTHMLTLDLEGGLVGGTDDVGRLHDHDGWLF